MSETVLVVPEAARGTLLATGPDAATWLNGLLTCDVPAVRAEQGGFGLLLSKQGKIQSDFTLLAGSGGLLLGVAPDSSAQLLAQLDRFLVMEDAEISDASVDWAWVHFYAAGALSGAQAAARALAGFAASVVWAGIEGAALAFPRSRLAELPGVLSGIGLAPANNADWEAFRIAHGIGRFGLDFGSDDNPHEAALDRRAISWSKGCYLGQEVVCMQDMRGKLKRRLVPLAIDDAAPPAPGAKVTLAAGIDAGEVTSSAPGATHAWALARLKSPYFEGEEQLWVEGHAARVEGAG